MSSITANQIKCLQDDPVLSGIVKCSDKKLSELEFIPSTEITGTSFRFWKRTKRIDTPIYVKACEGVCAEQAGWQQEKRDLHLIRRKMESCADAITLDNNGDNQPLPVWDETRMEEMAGIRRRIVRGMYEKESASAGATLEDYTVIEVDALAQEWNGSQDFPATTQAEIDALGGLTTIYLVNASLGGLHWAWGNGRQFNFTAEQFVDVRDEEKSKETGKNCTYPGIVQHVDAHLELVAKCEFDVVAIRNVPCGQVDKFYLDNVLEKVAELVYESATVTPNYAIVPTIVKTNWYQARKKQGLDVGGCCFMDVIGSNAHSRLAYLEDIDLRIMTSSCIPEQDAYITGNVTTKKIFNEVGDLQLN